MSDFIVSIGKKCMGDDLLNLLKRPYGECAPDGRCFSFSWGSMAVLNERLVINRNIIIKGKAVFAWVGDLVGDVSDKFICSLIDRITELQDSEQDNDIRSDEVFRKLNGAFAIILANETGFCIVTDPMSFVPVYIGRNTSGQIVSTGTHPDLVAAVSNECLRLDYVSLAEFLNSGTCTFPNTMYVNIKELQPGRVHVMKVADTNKLDVREYIYWLPPEEKRSGYDEIQLAEELQNALVSAVRDRCNVQKVAVLLSGGLDSRLIMAAVPEFTDCIGLTFCDEPNRETRIAHKVARAYNRAWFPLIREREYLGNSIVSIVKLVGCEFDWVEGQVAGSVDEIVASNANVVLHGLMFDVYLKGVYASDWTCVKRLGGLLPAIYERMEFDFVNDFSEFMKQHLNPDLLKEVHERRNYYYKSISVNDRGSSIERYKLYPFSQDTVAEWTTARRLFPVRLVAADRRILNFAFKCPLELKLCKKMFLMAALGIYGTGAMIPCANDGVRPGSGHWWRLVQRAGRKLYDRTSDILEKVGKEKKIQHSWHDYQKYWRESPKLDELKDQYGVNLDQFDGVFFHGTGRELLYRKDIHWQYGFRMLQMAVWLRIIEDYRKNWQAKS